METESVRRLHKKFHVACKNKDFRLAIFLGNLRRALSQGTSCLAQS